MSLVAMTAESLTRDLGEEVEEVMVVIGKHEVQGFDSKVIAEILGVTVEEIESVQKIQLYQNMLLLMKVEYGKGRIATDLTWDGLEEVALERLFKRVQNETDAEFLLKAATMANRAQRRQKPNNVLDPSAAGVRVPLTLTRRSINRIHADGTQENGVEETLRINDGRMVNPSFGDVDALLSVTPRPFLEKAIEVKAIPNASPDVDQMMDEVRDADSWA